MLIPIDAFWSEKKITFFKKTLVHAFQKKHITLSPEGPCAGSALNNLFSVVFPYLSKLLFTLYNVNWVGTAAAAQTQQIHTVRKHEESATTNTITFFKDDKYGTTTQQEPVFKQHQYDNFRKIVEIKFFKIIKIYVFVNFPHSSLLCLLPERYPLILLTHNLFY